MRDHTRPEFSPVRLRRRLADVRRIMRPRLGVYADLLPFQLRLHLPLTSEAPTCGGTCPDGQVCGQASGENCSCGRVCDSVAPVPVFDQVGNVKFACP